jgi:hypothetical protein
MKKFSQLRSATKVFEQEITLPKDSVGSVKVEINADGTQTAQQNPQGETTQEKENTQQQATGDVVKFFSKVFESREMAHVYHLTVKGEEGSNAKHLALGEYYEQIITMLDEIIEVYQGEYGVIEGYETIDTSATKSTDAVKYFEDLASFIKSEKQKCFKPEETHYFNIIDDIMVLIYKTLYKLKYNK